MMFCGVAFLPAIRCRRVAAGHDDEDHEDDERDGDADENRADRRLTRKVSI